MSNNKKTSGAIFLILGVTQFAVAAWYYIKLPENELEFGLHILVGGLATFASILLFRESSASG
jgi:hypothetical protein